MLRAIVLTKRDSLADAGAKDYQSRCHASVEEVRGIYSSEPLEGYTAALGTKVRTVDVQATVIALQQKSLIDRLGHGA